ncbi:hypothetical protein M2145_000003 [Lachnospiraceae bacterium PF1-21]|uniref:Uncharacterized protein n=1 Tax=Ohessyouella blattaphilus TaxID=2949333 RepID=A0ABT1EGT1_9FIRM|nr:hypothetical protein [Ohessyouella blattaphilus]MCP1109873.1 hypothetical protein [Ohessyouella blattaphilus]MCR8563267.1 hypothetical protein [Ohessyouella blattaphilus]
MRIAFKNKGIGRLMAMVCILTFLAGLLSGCGREKILDEEAGLSYAELKEISPAVAYLATRVRDCEGFLYIGGDGAGGEDEIAYLYDNALAMMALSSAGAQNHAEVIADAILYAMDQDRSFSDGRLRNAYIGGNPKDEANWSFWGGKRSMRMPGIWKDGNWHEDYYSIASSTGNMAWAIIGLCEVARNASEEKAEEYLEAAVKVGDFILRLRSETGAGGFTSGFEGWDDKNQAKVTYKSTEHNIDLVTAFAMLSGLIRNGDSEKAGEYMEAGEYAKDFVMAMYNKEKDCFYTGTEDDGETISEGVLPLDTNTWALLALGEDVPDVEKVFAFVEEEIAVEAGFDFSNGDLDGIWNEGTAQMAVCYKVYGKTAAYEKVLEYLNSQMDEEGSITAADRDSVSTGFVVSGTDVKWEFHKVKSISATSWLAFAQMGVNPMAVLL